MNTARNVPGYLTAAAYSKLANAHRPTDHASIAAEIRRLYFENKLRPRDIAQALRIDLNQVLCALNA